ncbi:hypothetical protein ACWGHM_41850 [Streptomyces sp. NPDC054904]
MTTTDNGAVDPGQAGNGVKEKRFSPSSSRRRSTLRERQSASRLVPGMRNK